MKETREERCELVIEDTDLIHILKQMGYPITANADVRARATDTKLTILVAWSKPLGDILCSDSPSSP